MPAKILDPPVKSLAAVVLAGLAFAAATLTGACGEAEPEAAENAALRRAQARELATRAGLPEGVARVIEAAAGSVAATYTVTYRAASGAVVTIYADPPRRRVDVSVPGQPDRRTIATADETLVCTRRTSATWRCEVAPPSDPPGGFSPDQLAATVDALDGTADVRAERDHIAGVDARCIVAGEVSLCVSATGVPLRVAGLGEAADLEATRYRPSVRRDDFRPPPRER